MPDSFAIAARLLSQREHSAYGLKQKLIQKGILEPEADEVLAKCKHLDLQSDARFAEALIRAKANRGYGPLVIRQFLREARVADDIICVALDAFNEQMDWMDAVKRVRDKKFRDQDVTALKQKQFLRYRGFSEEMVRPLFD